MFNARFQTGLIRANVGLYVYYFFFSILSFALDSEEVLFSLILVMTLAYFAANILLIYYGQKVYKQVF